MAGAVLPKLSIFLFLSIICMLVNISACVYASSLDYMQMDEYDFEGNIEDSSEKLGTDITVSNYVGGVATSFIPFASIINVAFLGIDATIFYFITTIITIIGGLQALMIALIVLCFLPNVLGSGVDV